MITKRKTTGVRMPAELNDKLTDIAERKGISKNAIMLEALWKYLKSERR